MVTALTSKGGGVGGDEVKASVQKSMGYEAGGLSGRRADARWRTLTEFANANKANRRRHVAGGEAGGAPSVDGCRPCEGLSGCDSEAGRGAPGKGDVRGG